MRHSSVPRRIQRASGRPRAKTRSSRLNAAGGNPIRPSRAGGPTDWVPNLATNAGLP